ncbi:tRNA pseudouridine(13) synthase TruD, partial [Candidatus Micrarchaeota archaeon]|nr:tRNA pseudouridine(13) synthase TruD [Candidatus Micrarchaeota archaeon]
MFKQIAPEEFIVEEITKDGLVLEIGEKYSFPSEELERNYYCNFVMQKKNWNTIQAIQEIARRLGIKMSRFSFAGTKDRNAITTQLVSCFALEKERLLPLTDIRDVLINGVWISKNGVKLGDLNGNRFTITLTKENSGKELTTSEVL